MTLEEFVDDLGELAIELSEPQQLLLRIGGGIVEDMKSRVPVDTGYLRNNIRVSVTGNDTIVFSMPAYGAYQNYGVGGTDGGAIISPGHNKPWRGGSLKQPFGITDPAIVGPFRYSSRRYGIPSRQFYDEGLLTTEIGEQFLDEIIVDF